MAYSALLFYQYTRIDDPKTFMDRERAVCEVLELKGRVIIAEEGINATLEGSAAHIEKYIVHLRKDKRFKRTDFKITAGRGDLFPRLSVKVRPEIVTTHLPKEIDPTKDTGVHLTPEQLRRWYEEGKEFEIIDMRNDFEFDVGHFKGSKKSGMAHFRDLVAIAPKLEDMKDKPVLTVCTGGVRCEKASAYLKSIGFNDVYQLEGGLHRYMEKYPGQDFLGTLYTFDGRVTMDWGGDREVVGKCALCGETSETFTDCLLDTCGAHFIACEVCRKGTPRAYCMNHQTEESALL